MYLLRRPRIAELQDDRLIYSWECLNIWVPQASILLKLYSIKMTGLGRPIKKLEAFPNEGFEGLNMWFNLMPLSSISIYM